jgi:F-type H+-transporting ATPase subunit b
MPQIAQIIDTYASQIFWLLVIFGLIYFGIGRSMLPKIESTVEARDARIAGDLAAAQAARAKADETEEAYRLKMETARAESLKATHEAKAAAALEAEKRVKAADAELAVKAAEADARLQASLSDALKGIEDVAIEAAQEIVARISGASVGRDEAAGAVKAALANG